MPITGRTFQLAARPKGLPTPDDFAMVEAVTPDAGEGEVQVQNLLLSVQMDCQCGNTQDRAVQLDQLGHDFSAFASDHHTTSNAEVSIEPGVPQTASICLNANLNKAITGLLAHGFDAETGRVGVGANHRDWVSRLPCRTDSKGNDGGGIAGKVVFAARLDD